MKTDWQLVGAIGLCLAVMALATFAMLHNPTARVNRRFGVMALVTAGWTLAISLALAAENPRDTILLGRIGFAFASGIPFTLIWMVDSLSDAGASIRRLSIIVPGLLCLIFVGLSLGPWIVAGAVPGIPRSNFVHGPLHRWFGVYFLLCFAGGIYMLFRASRHALGITRVQLRYLLLGISLTGAGAITTNLLIPLFGKTSKYSVLGPYFSLLFFAFSTHAIIRHRLMNIRLIVRRGIVYLFAALVVGGIFATFLGLASTMVGQRLQETALGKEVEVLVALGIAFAFQPLKGWIQSSMDRYLYRESYNYQQILREASRTIGSTLDLQSLLGYVCELVQRTFRPDLVSVYIRESGSGNDRFRREVAQAFGEAPGTNDPNFIISSSALPTFLGTHRQPLLRDELGRSELEHRAQTVLVHLAQLGADFVLPMFSEHQLIGFLLLGPKLSGDAYFAEDVELLITIANQAAIAVKNAQLYRQVVLVNEYVENILRTMDSGVITIDADGKVALSNSTAERLIGYGRDTLATMKVDQLPQALAGQLKTTLMGGESRLQEETSLPGPASRRTPLVCSSSALKDDRGAIVGALIVFSDLSNVKALEDEKRRAERLASLGVLVAGIAHEIKNPLVAIKTFAELLPERFADPDFRHGFSGVVSREIDRIDGLVGRLRSLAAPSSQFSGSVDIHDPILDTLSLLRAQFEQFGTVVHRYFAEAPMWVVVPADQLKQVFLNLFLNAIEAMAQGGVLTVRTKALEKNASSWVVVEVSDTGPGISEAIRLKIFDPFFTTKSRGSGLGLAICHSITDAHRGTIRAENNAKGRGTTIILEFPAAVEASALARNESISA